MSVLVKAETDLSNVKTPSRNPFAWVKSALVEFTRQAALGRQKRTKSDELFNIARVALPGAEGTTNISYADKPVKKEVTPVFDRVLSLIATSSGTSSTPARSKKARTHLKLDDLLPDGADSAYIQIGDTAPEVKTESPPAPKAIAPKKKGATPPTVYEMIGGNAAQSSAEPLKQNTSDVKTREKITLPSGEEFTAHYKDGDLTALRNAKGHFVNKIEREMLEAHLMLKERGLENTPLASERAGSGEALPQNTANVTQTTAVIAPAKEKGKYKRLFKGAAIGLGTSIKDRATSLVTGDEKAKAWKELGLDVFTGATISGTKLAVAGAGAAAGFSASAGVLTAAGLATSVGLSGAGASYAINRWKQTRFYATEEGIAALEQQWTKDKLAYNAWSDEERAKQIKIAAHKHGLTKAKWSLGMFSAFAAVGAFAETFLPEEVSTKIKLMGSSALTNIKAAIGITPQLDEAFTPPAAPTISAPTVPAPETANPISAPITITTPEVTITPEVTQAPASVIEEPATSAPLDAAPITAIDQIDGYDDMALSDKKDMAYFAHIEGNSTLAKAIVGDIGEMWVGPGTAELGASWGLATDAPTIAVPVIDTSISEDVTQPTISDAPEIAQMSDADINSNLEKISIASINSINDWGVSSDMSDLEIYTLSNNQALYLYTEHGISFDEFQEMKTALQDKNFGTRNAMIQANEQSAAAADAARKMAAMQAALEAQMPTPAPEMTGDVIEVASLPITNTGFNNVATNTPEIFTPAAPPDVTVGTAELYADGKFRLTDNDYAHFKGTLPQGASVEITRHLSNGEQVTEMLTYNGDKPMGGREFSGRYVEAFLRGDDLPADASVETMPSEDNARMANGAGGTITVAPPS